MSGTYNFATSVADMEVLGLLSRKISTMLGPVGNFSINTLTSEVLVHSLEEKGFCVSTVSACGSKISKGSYVIRSMYNNDKYASSSVRVSLSKLVKENDIDLFIKSVKEIIRK
jgi:cysteine desulfurase